MHPISLLEREPEVFWIVAGICILNEMFPIFILVYYSRFGHLFYH